MTTAIAHHTCSCGLAYSLEEWQRLPLKAYFVAPNDDGELFVADMRNCTCGSTRSSMATPPETQADLVAAQVAINGARKDKAAFWCLYKWSSKESR